MRRNQGSFEKRLKEMMCDMFEFVELIRCFSFLWRRGWRGQIWRINA